MPASIQAGLASGTSARYAVAGREFEDFLRSFEKLWAESSLKGEPIPWRLQRRCRRLTGGPPTGKPSATPLQTPWNRFTFQARFRPKFLKAPQKVLKLTPRYSVPGGSSARQSRLD